MITQSPDVLIMYRLSTTLPPIISGKGAMEAYLKNFHEFDSEQYIQQIDGQTNTNSLLCKM